MAAIVLSPFLHILLTNNVAAGDKGVIERLSYEFFHISMVEVLRIALFSIIWPVLLLVVLCLLSRLAWCREKIELFSLRIEALIITIGFEDIFRKKKRKELNEQYIKNALMTARSPQDEEKLNAIKQLSQYTEDSAFAGLIKLLSKEKDIAFQYMIVNALSNIIKKKKKNNH